IANIAQIVNVIAPVLTDGDRLLRQTIFEALAMFVNRREGWSLHLGYEGSTVGSPDFGDVAMVDGAAILNDNGELHVYAVNRSVDGAVDLEINLAGAHLQVLSSEILHHPTPSTQNTWENPHAVQRSPFETSDDAAPLVQLPPQSFFGATLNVTLNDWSYDG
ncbi:MAG: alpha-L-arabinofuranosidase C-terminal domain-containing protein, partial [Acidimicrobiales bacterium]|nr:alpha-L-arabinofuranosidase C-terminal domain-containing protein [Acidimicrobiales bacterium]